MDQGNKQLVSLPGRDLGAASLSFEELAAITNSLPGGVSQFACDTELTLLYANDGFYRICGYSREELQDKTGTDFLELMVPHEDVDYIYSQVDVQLKKSNKLRLEFRVRRKNAAMVWVRLDASVSGSGSGQDVMRCIFVDITSEKLLRQELEIEQERYRIITEQLNDVFFEYRFGNDSIYISSKWQEIFGYEPPQEHFLSSILSNEIVYDDDKGFLTQIMERVRQGEHTSEIEIRIRRAGGGYMWAGISVTVLCDGTGNPIKAIGKISDIDERKRERDKLISSAQHDPLTRLYNKIAVESFVRSCLRASEGNIRHALMIIDVDDFKGVNDRLGHLFGDAVLSEIAAKLRTLFRSTDIIGRFGGDEFLVFLKNVGSNEQVAQKAGAICDIFRQTYTGENKDYKISGSVGISIYPEHGKNFYELFQKADTALYTAKDQGKDGFVIVGEAAQQPGADHPSLSQNSEKKERRSMQQVLKNSLAMDIYELLCESNDGHDAIQFILRMIGREFDADHAYIYEGDGPMLRLSYEWHCEAAKPIVPAECPRDDFSYAYVDFKKDGRFYCPDLAALDSAIVPYRYFRPAGVKSVLQFPIIRNDVFVGVIGFDGASQWLADEQTVLKEICNIVGSFLRKFSKIRQTAKEHRLFQAMEQDAVLLSYVIQPGTYRLLYMNPMIEQLYPKAKLGEPCYSALRNRVNLCEGCPAVRKHDEAVARSDIYDSERGTWYSVSAASVAWEGEKASLLCGVDVTRYLKE